MQIFKISLLDNALHKSTLESGQLIKEVDMKKVVVFGHSLCEPCKTLKEMLRKADIPFEEMDVKTLPEPIRQNLNKKILAVSKIDTPTVPAVAVWRDGTETWFSNHGSCDVSEMFREIQLALGS